METEIKRRGFGREVSPWSIDDGFGPSLLHTLMDGAYWQKHEVVHWEDLNALDAEIARQIYGDGLLDKKSGLFGLTFAKALRLLRFAHYIDRNQGREASAQIVYNSLNLLRCNQLQRPSPRRNDLFFREQPETVYHPGDHWTSEIDERGNPIQVPLRRRIPTRYRGEVLMLPAYSRIGDPWRVEGEADTCVTAADVLGGC